MYKTALVKDKITDGARLVAALDRAAVQVRTAFWFFDREIEDWRLVIHFTQIDETTQTVAYGLIWRVMVSMHPKPSFGLDEVMLQDSTSSLIRAIQTVAPTPPAAIESQKIGPVSAGNVWIEDAYVYRSAA